MKQLFKKAAIFTDIHLGLKINSSLHNQDCLDFINWFVEQAQNNNCDVCIFLGDYFHNRNNTNLITMNYGLKGMQVISKGFERIYMIPGNHDNFYKDRRDINSIAWASHIQNIKILNEITCLDDAIFVPWLVQNEHKEMLKKKGTYVFGHFELPKFLMNAQLEMPDVGELKTEQFKNFYHVYTGHFHKRQTQNNVTYIGNAFPHNFGDAGDDDRGMMILPWGEEPTFIMWPDAPKYRHVKISDLVIDPSRFLPEKGYIKLLLDTDISYEEATYLKENLLKSFNLRELSLVSMKRDFSVDNLIPTGNIQIQSVDTIVQKEIMNINSDFYDTNILLDIYRGL